jgi:hypothetical protein
MVVFQASTKYSMSRPMETEPASALRVHPDTFQPTRIPHCAKNVPLATLPIPFQKMETLRLMNVSPVKEVRMGVQQQPVLLPKDVVIARVARIPNWKAFPMPVNVKDAHAVNGVLVLVSRKNPPVSIVVLASTDKTMKVRMPKRRVQIVVGAPFWKKLELMVLTVVWFAPRVLFKI